MLLLLVMPEPESEQHIERKVVYETTSASTTKQNVPVIIGIAVVVVALVVYILVQIN